MLLEDKVKIEKDGSVVECDIVFEFTCNETGRNYIGFTDHSTDEEGNENIYVKSYDPYQNEVTFENLTTDSEWDLVSEVLNSIKNGEV